MSIPVEYNYPPKTAEELVEEHFFTSQSGRQATESDKLLIADIQEKAKAVALTIFLDVPPGPNRMIAIRHLEDAQMRAIRAIFAPE